MPEKNKNMFGFGKTKKEENREEITTEKRSSVKEVDLLDRVHIMADDLVEQESRKSSAADDFVESEEGKIVTETKADMVQNEESSLTDSPFLSSSSRSEASRSTVASRPTTVVDTDNVVASTSPAVISGLRRAEKSPSSPKALKKPAQNSKRNIFRVIVAIFLLVTIVAAAAFYYYRQSLQDTPQDAENSAVGTSETSAPEPTSEEGNAPVSVSEALVLRLGEDVSQHALTAKIQELTRKIDMLSPEERREVRVLDQNGQPVTFEKFAELFLPLLPSDVSENLIGPLELYILPEGDDYRVGLFTLSDDPEQTRAALRQAEPLLPNVLRPLMLFSPENGVAGEYEFEDNSHKNIPIRFYNFKPDASQSVDYAIHYRNVFIGTSKKTMRQMMDMVFAREEEMKNQQITEKSEIGSKEPKNLSSEETEDLPVIDSEKQSDSVSEQNSFQGTVEDESGEEVIDISGLLDEKGEPLVR